MQADSSHAGRKTQRGFLHEQRYVLAVDGQRKASYADEDAALAQARKIQAAYPRLSVEVHDQERSIETLLRDVNSKHDPEPWPD